MPPSIQKKINNTGDPLQKDLSVDNNSLLTIFSEKRPSLILFQSYFGFNTLNKSIDLIKDLQNKGAIIVEDVSQSLLSEFHISFADYFVSSLRKFFAIPDGGFLISARNICHINKHDCNKLISKIAYEAFNLKACYFENELFETKEAFRKKYQELKQLIADNQEISDISPESLKILNSIDADYIRSKRRENYRKLESFISKDTYIEKIISLESCKNATPLYFPVYIDKRNEFQSYMANHRVYCPIIWPKSKLINIDDCRTEYMYRNMLCFPIDQRYGIEEMSRIVNLIKSFDFEV